ncbi:MAG: DUF3316 domain-containing protein [Prevotellaceae bacterium]|nr:DUF3316 domain-containing protein [Prevotellaceae bacterium]
MRYRLFLLVLLLQVSYTFAQVDTITSPKITTTANMIGIGHTNVLDDYLSNEKYRGAELRFISMTEKYNPIKRLTFQRLFQVDASMPTNNSETGSNLVGMMNYSLGWYYNWNFLDGDLRVQAGGLVDMNLGGILNTRNGNNAGQVRAYVNIAPSAAVTYAFRMWERNFSLRYSIDVPLFGLMFSPNYGQSYYEIFTRSNYDHNVVFTTIGCAPSMRQMLTLDFPIRKTTLRIGYLGDFQQAKVNGIKSHIWTNGVVFGIVKRFQIKKII